uniref:Uncharacterized protein n=1 Tax=Chromera velia CCMP2878 TaxID=1169474 RepID=A0A0G4ID28_9ALVE|eukprot:Cvel_103.t1-p1 / transcript=Cvel_103.t1 / gene=Cvel_103 / organism=Chromera_velia_CCMP2878 / gene_product=hypothetical protein / transcript_product=hypothetical protein / location=Cvel_scaffold8:89410-93884(-) / protein_length=544 / sequence_SO=supercontig / SO=protein_coding / is_pseudo=false
MKPEVDQRPAKGLCNKLKSKRVGFLLVICSIFLLLVATGLDVTNVIISEQFFEKGRNEAREAVLEVLSILSDEIDAFINLRVSALQKSQYEARSWGQVWTDPEDIDQFLNIWEPMMAVDEYAFAVYMGLPNRDAYKIYRTDKTKLAFEHRKYSTQKKRNLFWSAGGQRPSEYESWKDKEYDVFGKGWYKAGMQQEGNDFQLNDLVIEHYPTKTLTHINLVWKQTWGSLGQTASFKMEVITDTINELVANLHVGANSQTFITTSTGSIIAAPMATQMFKYDDSGRPLDILNIKEYEDPSDGMVGEALRKLPEEIPAEKATLDVNLDSESPMRVGVIPYQRNGADWRIVVVTYDNDFLSGSLSLYKTARFIGVTAIAMIAAAFVWTLLELYMKHHEYVHRGFSRVRRLSRRNPIKASVHSYGPEEEVHVEKVAQAAALPADVEAGTAKRVVETADHLSPLPGSERQLEGASYRGEEQQEEEEEEEETTPLKNRNRIAVAGTRSTLHGGSVMVMDASSDRRQLDVQGDHRDELEWEGIDDQVPADDI